MKFTQKIKTKEFWTYFVKIAIPFFIVVTLISIFINSWREIFAFEFESVSNSNFGDGKWKNFWGMKLFISFLISLMLIFSTPFAYALSGDPSDFVKPVSSKIVDGKLVTQYDIQYKGVVKQSSGFLNKLEVGKLMGKGFRKYFPALRALDLVQLALDSGLLFDTDSNTIYQKVEQKNNQVRVIQGTNILITRTANAPSGRTCMEAFNFYLANNQHNTTSATLVSCYYNYIDQIQLGMPLS